MTVLVGLAMVFGGLGAPERLPRDLRDVHRIVCMGDSITNMGDSEGGHGYVRLIRQTLQKLYPEAGFEVINVGIGGQKAPDMLGRWQRDVLDRHPDLVTLSVGINDVWHGFYDNHPKGDGPKGVALDVYERDVTEMIESAQAAKIRVVLVSPTVITEDHRKLENVKLQGYVDAERRIAKAHHIPFVDLHRAFLDRLAKLRSGDDDVKLHLTVDGVHMQPPGDHLMAYSILRQLGVPKQDLSDLEN